MSNDVPITGMPLPCLWYLGRSSAPLTTQWVPGSAMPIPSPYCCFIVVHLRALIGALTWFEFRIMGRSDPGADAWHEIDFNGSRLAYRYHGNVDTRIVVPVLGYVAVRGEVLGGGTCTGSACAFEYLNMSDAMTMPR